MEHLKKFETKQEYNAWKDGDDYVVPNICKVGEEVIYNNYPEPFWIEALEDITVDFKYYNGNSNTSVGQYSFDKNVWTKIPHGGVVLRSGQKIYIINGGVAYKMFVISGRYNVGGSILSLDYELDYLKYNTHSSIYFNFFGNARQVVSAKDLVLAIGYYRRLFYGCTLLKDSPKLIGKISSFNNDMDSAYEGCTSLTKAPTIPVLKSGDYTSNGLSRMFYGCSNLSYIKAMFTQYFGTYSYNDTTDWVAGVSPTGTFIANANRTDFKRGTNAIPEGWDLYLYDEEKDRYVVKFKVNGIPYEFYTDEPRNITWREFCLSEYNTNGFTHSGGYQEGGYPVKFKSDYVLLDGSQVMSKSYIILNAEYTIGQPTETTEE